MASPGDDRNPYAPPRSVSAAANRIPYVTTQLGLVWYAVLGLASIPFALLASQQADRAFVTGASGPMAKFNDLAGAFYGIRAIADLGLLLAFVAGLVWLHHAWGRSQGRRKKTVSARAVVAWSLVPVWGLWRLHGFLLELSKRCGLGEEAVRVGRWWWFLVLHIVVHGIAVQIHIPGWFHVLDSVLQATAALLGARMVQVIQRAQDVQLDPVPWTI